MEGPTRYHWNLELTTSSGTDQVLSVARKDCLSVPFYRILFLLRGLHCVTPGRSWLFPPWAVFNREAWRQQWFHLQCEEVAQGKLAKEWLLHRALATTFLRTEVHPITLLAGCLLGARHLYLKFFARCLALPCLSSDLWPGSSGPWISPCVSVKLGPPSCGEKTQLMEKLRWFATLPACFQGASLSH